MTDTYLGKVKRATNIALKAKNSICMGRGMSTEHFIDPELAL